MKQTVVSIIEKIQVYVNNNKLKKEKKEEDCHLYHEHVFELKDESEKKNM